MTPFRALLVASLASLTACIMPAPGARYATSAPPPSSGGASGTAGASSDGSDPSAPAVAGAEQASAPAPAAPVVVSVELHNDCEHDVKLFFGEKPGFSSGTSTSLESNSTTSYQMKPGDMIWITDDSENGVSSTSIGSSPSESLRIMPGCSGFGPN